MNRLGLFLSAPVVFAAEDTWVWPIPQDLSSSGDAVQIHSNFEFVVDAKSPVLASAVGRYQAFMRQNATGSTGALQQCVLAPKSTSEELRTDTDYAYQLSVDGGVCRIDSNTIYGAMYGMESLFQLASGGSLPGNKVSINDFPDYVHRGVMADTGRRFWPLSLVKNVLDVMSFNKMNVLHLHASDMCRFAVESKLFPELTASLAGIKEGHYTQDDIKEMIQYAKERGIRVVPEFDMPGHAACFIPMEQAGRGIEFCNRPVTSDIPNWCTLHATNGTAAWDLMPQLALEMAELFGSEVYHIGGDETRCGGSGSFEGHLLDVLEENGYRGMGWSEVKGLHDSNPNTIIQAWKGNASSLATEGIAAVDSEPSKFYVCCSKSTPGVTRAWSDLGKSEVPKENQHLHLGGEVAFWTDSYCYLNDCVRPGSGAGSGSKMFGPQFDAEFSKSVGGILWPRTHLAAGSFWHFRDDLSKDEVAQRANYKHNTLAAQRGGLVCPSGCDCTVTSICDEPIIPPTPPPPSPAPSSKHCHWQVDTGLAGNDIHRVGDVEDQRGCCAICHDMEGCAAADYNFLTKTCHLKNDVESVWRNDGSVACIPIVTTTTTSPSTLSV